MSARRRATSGCRVAEQSVRRWPSVRRTSPDARARRRCPRRMIRHWPGGNQESPRDFRICRPDVGDPREARTRMKIRNAIHSRIDLFVAPVQVRYERSIYRSRCRPAIARMSWRGETAARSLACFVVSCHCKGVPPCGPSLPTLICVSVSKSRCTCRIADSGMAS